MSDQEEDLVRAFAKGGVIVAYMRLFSHFLYQTWNTVPVCIIYSIIYIIYGYMAAPSDLWEQESECRHHQWGLSAVLQTEPNEVGGQDTSRLLKYPRGQLSEWLYSRNDTIEPLSTYKTTIDSHINLNGEEFEYWWYSFLSFSEEREEAEYRIVVLGSQATGSSLTWSLCILHHFYSR